jgi:hypothetical protein
MKLRQAKKIVKRFNAECGLLQSGWTNLDFLTRDFIEKLAAAWCGYSVGQIRRAARTREGRR